MGNEAFIDKQFEQDGIFLSIINIADEESSEAYGMLPAFIQDSGGSTKNFVNTR